MNAGPNEFEITPALRRRLDEATDVVRRALVDALKGLPAERVDAGWEEAKRVLVSGAGEASPERMLTESDLPIRITNTIEEEYGTLTWGEFMTLDEEKLLKINGFGRGRLAEVQREQTRIRNLLRGEERGHEGGESG